MSRLSIGLRLTLAYFLIFALSQTIFGFAIWVVLRHNLYDLADDALEDEMDDVRHSLAAQPPDVPLVKLQQEITETYTLDHVGEYLQIVDDRGNWVYSGPPCRLDNCRIPYIRTGEWGDDPFVS